MNAPTPIQKPTEFYHVTYTFGEQGFEAVGFSDEGDVYDRLDGLLVDQGRYQPTTAVAIYHVTETGFEDVTVNMVKDFIKGRVNDVFGTTSEHGIAEVLLPNGVSTLDIARGFEHDAEVGAREDRLHQRFESTWSAA